MTTTPSKRNQDIYDLRQSGATLSAICKQHQLTRERVRQISHRVSEWLERVRERDRRLEEAGLAAMSNEPKLEAIALQLDEIEHELHEMATTATDLSTDALDLSVRARNVIRNLGIATVGDLLRWSETDLLWLPNMGRKSVREIQDALAYLGCALPTVSQLTPNEREVMDAIRAGRWREASSLMRTLRQSVDG